MDTRDLPGVNATLNAVSACLLALGYFFTRRVRRDAHRRAMLAAAVPVLAGITLARATRPLAVPSRHRALDAMPIWLYVSLTGVMVYWMLYRL